MIEVLVTGVLSTIVAGSLVTTLTLVNNQIQDGILDNRLGRIQTVVSEQIRSSTRKSWAVLQSTDPVGAKYGTLPAVPTTQEILLDNLGTTIPLAKYRINSGVLEEWHTGDPAGYYPFKIGDEIVHVDPSNSWFSLPAGRKRMSFQLTYVLNGKTLPGIQEVIQCRNVSSN